MYNGYLPYPQYPIGIWGAGGLGNVDPPLASSTYNGLVVRIEKQFSKGLQFLADYTNQKSMDNASIAGSNVWVDGIAGGTLASVQDPNCLRCEWSLSQFDVSQVVEGSVVYQLPYGRGRMWGSSSNAVVNEILGGWELSGTYRWDSGQPILLGGSGGSNIPTFGGQRVDLSGPLDRSSNWKNAANGTGNYFANAASVITKPQAFFEGNAPRVLPNIRAPGTNNLAMSIYKDFPLGFKEGASLQFRAEAFNALNHVQFAAPNLGPSFDANNNLITGSSTSFGNITSQANSPRILQLGLKFNF